MKPEIVEKLNRELIEAISEDDKPSISIDRAAKILGVDRQTLRVAIANGTCPVGLGGQHPSGSKFGRVSKLALYNWITKGIEWEEEPHGL